MNLPTIIILVILAVLAVLAVIYIVRDNGRDHCSGCSNEACGGMPEDGVCPSAQQAISDVESRLGPKDQP